MNHYTIVELDEKLKELEISQREFSTKDLIALTRKPREEADKEFAEYQNDRLKEFTRKLKGLDLSEKGDKNG